MNCPKKDYGDIYMGLIYNNVLEFSLKYISPNQLVKSQQLDGRTLLPIYVLNRQNRRMMYYRLGSLAMSSFFFCFGSHY